MQNRITKAFRDHIFRKDHNWDLHLDLADAPYKVTAETEGFDFFVTADEYGPEMDRLRHDFPRQSRTFGHNIRKGCIMFCVAKGGTVMGYFIVALRPYFDRDCFRLTFPAGGTHCYAFNFYVDPRYRKFQIARVVLTEGFAWLRARGYLTLATICRAEARPLFRLYRQFGFRPTGRGIDQYYALHQTRSRWTTQKTPPKRAR